MTLQPEDFWSYGEWLLRPNAFLRSALLQGVVLTVLAILVGLVLGYLLAAARKGPSEGFYAVARVIREMFVFDLPGTSVRRVYALSRLAFKEAIRRRVLVVAGVFVVILLFAGWYLNPKSDDPAQLYISFVLTATNYLILLLALFISCFSIPADIQNKTLYTIVTKPVRPTEIVLGRIFGFAAVGTCLLVPMGLASYLFVKGGLNHDHAGIQEIEQQADGTYVGKTTYDRHHQHTFTLTADEAGNLEGVTDIAQGHQHSITKAADSETYVIGPPTGALTARVPSYGSLYFLSRTGQRSEQGIDTGQEKGDGGYGSAGLERLIGRTSQANRIEFGYVEGGNLSAGIYTFDDVTPGRYQDGLPLQMNLRAYRAHKGKIDRGLRGTVTLRNPDTGAASNALTFIVDEYEVDELMIPETLAGNDGQRNRDLNLFEDLVNENGQLQLEIRCLDRGQYLGMTQGDVFLKPRENPFAWNFAKAYISIWLQMIMVISFGVMFSTFLNGAVAMLLTLVCVLLGFSAETIYDVRHHIDINKPMGGGPLESMIRIAKQDAMTTELDVDTLTSKIVKGVDTVIVYSMDVVATSLPNLPKMVETAEYAANGFDIFGSLLARHATTTLAYLLLTFFVSYFCLKTREIAA
ncbi:ABC transporter permease [Roseimaritima sediminicola]|uniref:ABC transporter permease n=1 Tax=Roseimaritima sediminicola TaxID=2662066 RepID=UPI0012984819|nr:ABC transporter permease [Roseimaritima sediminicola]